MFYGRPDRGALFLSDIVGLNEIFLDLLAAVEYDDFHVGYGCAGCDYFNIVYSKYRFFLRDYYPIPQTPGGSFLSIGKGQSSSFPDDQGSGLPMINPPRLPIPGVFR